MADVRAMFVMQGGSNLPEDRFINTWHFSSGASYAAHVVTIQEALADFYIEVPSGSLLAVGKYISPYAKRAATLKCYDLSTAEPRVSTDITITLPTPSLASGLPEEVACCLSFAGAPPVTARRRGRIYLGPLNYDAVDDGDTTLPARTKVGMQQSLVSAATNLLAAGVGWAIRSVASGGTFVPVATGWVDNALDSQRRRGPDASSRLTFPTV